MLNAVNTEFFQKNTSVHKDTRTGLSDGTWTHGLYHPKVARYQLRHTQMLFFSARGIIAQLNLKRKTKLQNILFF